MYGLKQEYAHRPGQSVPTVGQPDKLPYEDFIRYSLNPPGMSTIITGIGLTDKDDDPERDQLVANLAAAQTAKPLSDREKKDIEQTVAELHGTRTNFFQRPSSGFQPPQGFAAQRRRERRGPPGVALGIRCGRPDRTLRGLPPARTDRDDPVPAADDPWRRSLTRTRPPQEATRAVSTTSCALSMPRVATLTH